MDTDTTPEPNAVRDPEQAGMTIAMGAYFAMEQFPCCCTPEALCAAVDHLLRGLIAGAGLHKRPDIIDRVRALTAEVQPYLDEPASIFTKTEQ